MLTDIILPEDLKTLDTQSLVQFLDYNLNKKRVVEKDDGEVTIEEDECVFTPAMQTLYMGVLRLGLFMQWILQISKIFKKFPN